LLLRASLPDQGDQTADRALPNPFLPSPRLVDPPAAGETITASLTIVELPGSAAGAGASVAVSPSKLSFTAGNYNANQAVTVSRGAQRSWWPHRLSSHGSDFAAAGAVSSLVGQSLTLPHSLRFPSSASAVAGKSAAGLSRFLIQLKLSSSKDPSYNADGIDDNSVKVILSEGARLRMPP
jgi:hypothetical protein